MGVNFEKEKKTIDKQIVLYFEADPNLISANSVQLVMFVERAAAR